jgi:hypothetical protein
MADHDTFSPSQDLGTLLMLILQVNLQHPNTDQALLQYGKAGRIISAEFDRNLATVDHETIALVPDLSKLVIETSKGRFEVAVRELL